MPAPAHPLRLPSGSGAMSAAFRRVSALGTSGFAEDSVRRLLSRALLYQVMSARPGCEPPVSDAISVFNPTSLTAGRTFTGFVMWGLHPETCLGAASSRCSRWSHAPFGRTATFGMPFSEYGQWCARHSLQMPSPSPSQPGYQPPEPVPRESTHASISASS